MAKTRRSRGGIAAGDSTRAERDALTTRHAEARIQVAQETGRSPYDPAVIREAHRRVADRIEADVRRVRAGQGDAIGAGGDPLSTVIQALRDVRGEGRFGDRKVFVAALWDRVGSRVGMSLPEFKRWLLRQHRERRLVLARADLVAAMPPDMVGRSEARFDDSIAGARYHFVVDPSTY